MKPDFFVVAYVQTMGPNITAQNYIYRADKYIGSTSQRKLRQFSFFPFNTAVHPMPADELVHLFVTL